MLPPETMHTILSPGTSPDERRRERERAGALGDDARALGEQPDRGRRVVER